MATAHDWQRDDTVVLYRSPASPPYTDEDYAEAATATLAALDVAIPKPKVVLKLNVVYGVAP